MHIPEGFTLIPRTKHYYLSKEGFVYNLKTRKRLKKSFDGHDIYTWVFDTDGKKFKFFYNKKNKIPLPHYPLERVMEECMEIPDYPDYAINPRGLVWRITPREKGPNAGRIYVLSEHIHQNKTYVWLVHPDNSLLRKRVRPYHLAKQVWGDDADVDDE